MTRSHTLLFLALVAGANAGPYTPQYWPSPPTDLPASTVHRCSTDCPVTGQQKFHYVLNKVYYYEYFGQSKVQLVGVEGGASVTDWSASVQIKWFGGCDLIIMVKDFKVDGDISPPHVGRLQRYPLVVALNDGLVHHVCNHPNDDVWSINIKKGIASAFQNSLASLSSINSGQNLTETDVVGRCSTNYEVESEGDRVLIKKRKNHRLCQERYPTPAETHVPWLKGPLPLEESSSLCEQEIKNGIYRTIKCEDKNMIRPSYGAYKYVVATQESTLRLLSGYSQEPPDDFTNLQSRMIHGSLQYSYGTAKKDPSLLAELNDTMTLICERTANGVELDAAALVSKAVQLLRRVPGEDVEKTLDKIRKGQYCRDYRKLESLFLDAVAFVYESGAVRVLVKELMEGGAIGGRAALYTTALHLLPRPNIYAMGELKPLFESSHQMPSTILAAASLVNTYCRHIPNCHHEPTIKSIVETLSRKLENQCSPTSGHDTQKEALTTLKALGNIGVMTEDLSHSIMRCLEPEEVKTNIRVAAAHTFRQARCLETTTTGLVNIILDSTKNTEVRIAAYLIALRCIQQDDLGRIISKISKEVNTQVRGFILSHLAHVLKSHDPKKRALTHLLSSYKLPADYMEDFRKYSRNIDLSYFVPSLGVGAGVETNMVYAPGSFVLRSLDYNISAVLEGTAMNIVEVGVRLEGLDAIIQKIFGPKSSLRKASTGKILEDIAAFAEQGGKDIIEQLYRAFQENTSTDLPVLSKILGWFYSGNISDVVHADMFIRYLGQELIFANFAGNPMTNSTEDIKEIFTSYLNEIFNDLDIFNIDSVRTGQLYLDYSFPTIQGTPLKLELQGTAVVGLKFEGNFSSAELFSSWTNGESSMRVSPSLSVEAKGFIGYDSFLTTTGIKINSNVSSSSDLSIVIQVKNQSDFEIYLDVPHKTELFELKTETYLMKGVLDRPDTRITPEAMRDVRFRFQSCYSGLEPTLGLRFCCNIDVPDVFRSNSLPLGAPTVAKVYIEKTEPSMTGYLMHAALRHEENSRILTLKAESSETAAPRVFEAVFSHTRQEDSFSVSAAASSSSFTSGVWLTVVNEQFLKSVETYINFMSNDTEISRGIKFDFETTTTLNEEGYEIHVYSGPSQHFPPESHVIEGKFIHRVNGPEVSLDVVYRTENALRDYIDLNLEFGADFTSMEDCSILVPTKLRQFELHSGLRGWNVSSSIYRSRDTGDTVEYSSAFKVSRRKQDLISVVASSTTEGRLDQNFSISTGLRVKVGGAEYKAAQYLRYGRFKYGGSIHIISSDTNRTILDLEAFVSHFGKLYHAKFLLDVPDYMRLIKFEARVTEKREHHYMTQVLLQHGPRVVLHVDGPVTALFSPQMLKLRTNLRIDTLANGAFNVDFTLISSISEKIFSISLAKHGPIISVAWILTAPNAREINIHTKFLLPAFIDFNVHAALKEELIHMDLNTLLLPDYSFARRVILSSNISMEHSNGTFDLLWDADRDPSQKISVDGAVVDISNSSNPNQTLIHGNIAYVNEIYPFAVDLPTPHLSIYHTGEQGFDLEITTPAHKTLGLEMKTNIIEEHSTFTIVRSYVRYKNLENKQYKIVHVLCVENLGNPHSYKVGNELNFTSPEGKVWTLNTNAKHYVTDTERLVDIRTMASTPALRRPLHVELILNNTVTSCTIKASTMIHSPANMFSWELDIYPQGGVKNLESAIDLRAVRHFLDTILQMASLKSEEFSVIPIEGYERSTYRYHYHKPSPSAYSLLLQYPARTVQAEATYSPSRSSLTFYPDRDESEAKYEIGVQSSHSYWRQQSRYQGHISHPSLTRDVRAEVQYGVSGDNLTGTIELDIFPDTADKITGTFESAKISDTTIKSIAHLTTRVLKEKPQVTLVIARSPQKVGFDFEFQKNSTAPASVSVLSLYEEVSDTKATVAFSLSLDGDSVVFVSGTLRDDDEDDCFGTRMWGKARTSLLGNYDIESRVCEPAFIELTTKKEDGDAYTIRLGVQGEENIEFSITGGDKEAIARAQLSLPSHTVVSVDMAYHSSKFNALQADASDVVRTATSATSAWAQMVYQTVKEEAQEKGLIFPNPELLSLVLEVNSDLWRIWEEVIYGPVVHQYEALCHMLDNSDIVSLLKHLAHHMWSAMVQMQHDLRYRILQEVLAWPKYFQGIAQKLITAIKEIAHIMETGELSGTVRTILHQWKRLKFLRVLAKNIDTMFEQHPEEYSAIKHVASNIIHSLQQDLENIRRKYMDIPAVQSTIHWIIENFNHDHMLAKKMDKRIAQIIQDAVFVSLETGSYYVRLRIPLGSRVGSLTHALLRLFPDPETFLKDFLWIRNSNISPTVKDMIWVYYSLLPRHITDLLPPYNQTAVAVDGTELITFDGTLLRAPRSECQLLLASYASSKVTIVHPETSPAAQVTFLNPHTNVTVKPDFSVEINGKEMNKSHETIGEIFIEKSPYEVKLVSSLMTLRVDKEEHSVFVDVSGWGFGHLTGILGNYDGEVANDWLMPSGEKAKDFRQLVSSWQEDKSCPTPPLEPKEHSLLRDGQCSYLLYGHELCFPLVNPEPYTKMCSFTDNICDSLYAYDSICTSKGLELELPSGCW